MLNPTARWIVLSLCLMWLNFCVADLHAEDKKTPAQTPDFFLRTFDPDDSRRLDWTNSLGTTITPRSIDPTRGDSLVVKANFPAVSHAWRGTYERPVRFALTHRSPAIVMHLLQYEVFIPAALPPRTRVQSRLVLKDKDGIWFEAIGRRKITRRGQSQWEPATSLHPGWNTIMVDLSDTSTDFRPRGHRMRWSRFLLSRMSMMGFAISADHAYQGEIAIDNLKVWRAHDRPIERAVGSDAPPRRTAFAQKLRIIDFTDGTKGTVNRYGRAEFTLRVNRPILNPFRYSEIAIDAEFTPPDGGDPVRVPAFYDQDFTRVKGIDNAGYDHRDRYIPTGPGVFKIRFTPRQSGKYTYRITVQYASPLHTAKNANTDAAPKEIFTSAPRTLQVSDRPHRGFVRIAKTNARLFEFENGEFFYPVGHSFRSPNDPRYFRRILRPGYGVKTPPLDRGLRAYEELIPRMKKSGVNAFEIWLCSWWLGLEWTGKWRGYYGLGSYNLENAWKLDRIVEMSERNGQYIHLTIDNHGKAGQSPQHDHEFDTPGGGSPYWRGNRQDGGFLRRSTNLFSNAKARRHYKDKLRYIAARWGWSTNIYGLELWSELDLVGHKQGRHRDIYASNDVRNWHREMAAWLKSQDHGNHIVTTHYSGDYSVIDRKMIRQPFIDYITGDAYHTPKETLMFMLARTDDFARPFGKPYQITEYGGYATANTREGITGDLYGGLWFSWMTGAAGTPLYWWFEHLAMQDYFSAYKSFSRYIAGEDKRRARNAPPLRPRWNLWRGQNKIKGRKKKADRGFFTKGKPIRVISPHTSTKANKNANSKVKKFSAAALDDGTIFYAYVYDHRILHHMPINPAARPVYNGVSLILEKVLPGTYAVEVWDCWTGGIVQKQTLVVAAKASRLTVKLPKFTAQVALKIRRKTKSP